MANAFFVRCDCRNRRFTGGKSRFLQEADGRKGIASAADELCGSALEKEGSNHAYEGGITRMPGSNNGAADRQQVEAADNAEPSFQVLEIQRAAEIP